MKLTLKHTLGASAGALLTSSATLLCCALPALLVSLGAGAALAGLVSAFPQLIWLSERKAAVFSIAGLALLVSGAMLWYARQLPCPTEPEAARACMRVRRLSRLLLSVAVCAYVLGAIFAFLLPNL